MLRAAVYARKSTAQDGVSEDAKSVTRQIEQARAFAARKGWAVLSDHIYVDDAVSGAEWGARRPAFVRLMASLKPRAPFDVLIVSEESRIGRESVEVGYAVKQLTTSGVRLFCYLTDSERRLDSPIDKIMLALSSYSDEMERERARQRTADAMLRKAKQGHVCGGACYGYRSRDVMGDADPAGRRPRLHVARVVYEPEAEIVREIFARYGRGEGLIAIAKALNAERKPSPRAQRGRPSGWSPSSIRALLLRPTYRGVVTWNRSQKRDGHGAIKQRPRPESDWIVRVDESLRIVTDEAWQAVQARFAEHARTGVGLASSRPGTSAARYLLTGLVRCACGSGFEAVSRKSGTGRRFAYACAAHRRRGPMVCSNDLLAPMQLADDAVLDLMESVILQPSILTAAIDRAVSLIVGDGSDDRRKALETEADALRAQLARLVSALADGGASDTLAAAIRERETSLRRLDQEIASLLAAPRDFDRAKVRRELAGKTADWKALLRNSPRSGHAALRALIVDRLTFTPQGDGDQRSYAISGAGTVQPLLSGVLQGMASPTGLVSVYTFPLNSAFAC